MRPSVLWDFAHVAGGRRNQSIQQFWNPGHGGNFALRSPPKFGARRRGKAGAALVRFFPECVAKGSCL